MEGKAALVAELAGIDAVPICLDTPDVDEIVGAVTAIAPSFGGINLEDISAPRCFEVEKRLRAHQEYVEVPHRVRTGQPPPEIDPDDIGPGRDHRER